jgi:hypothetical protein
MLWFRHNNDMRNRPEMKHIANALGAHGVAAAYRLLEVWCDLAGSGENFDPTLVLSGARGEQWLAQEILLPDYDDDRESSNGVPDFYRSTKRLQEFLVQFELAGLIELGTCMTAGWRIDENGKKVSSDAMEFQTITLLAADGILDSFTSRYKGPGVGKGKGYRSDRA